MLTDNSDMLGCYHFRYDSFFPSNNIIDDPFNLEHFSFVSFGEDDEPKIDKIFHPFVSEQTNLPLITMEESNEQKKKLIFQVNFRKHETLYPESESNSILFEGDESLLGRKRWENKRPRKDNRDNIRKKSKRGFFNFYLFDELNEMLSIIGSNKYFVKFPQFFVSDIDKKRNKEILELTLEELLTNVDIYKYENEIGLENFKHNLKVVQSEIKENSNFKKIFDKTIRELYEEYLNSDQFRIKAINRLKKNKMNDDYIKRYIYLSKHLIEYFEN